MGQDVNWPPYAFKNSTTNELEGFGIDVARGVQGVCSAELEFEFVETKWSNCWSAANGGELGASIVDGTLDACMTYTHTYGRRDTVADFSHGILAPNKAAGLLTRLVNGCPVVSGSSDLSGITVVDVAGWAPTADGLGYVENKCTKTKYSNNYTLIQGTGNNPNDASLSLLLDGSADAMFVYADQAKNYQCGNTSTDEWNCTLWAGWGTAFAYVQTGQMGHAANGTTLTIAKQGSFVPDLVNPCLAKFLETEDYYKLCQKHGLEDQCYHNSFFPTKTPVHESQKETTEHKGTCSSGYCPCQAAPCPSPEEPSVSGSPSASVARLMPVFGFAFILYLA